jgi:CheY-like chemotaxis protein
MKRVLICDNDMDTLYLANWILTGAGWTVFTSTNCNNIVEQVKECSPSVIIMDISIPEEGGVVATQTLKKHPDTQHIPVIIFSAFVDIESFAEEAGTDYYLSKPFLNKQLEDIVMQVHDEVSNSHGVS